MECKACGTQMANDAAFCPECGQAVSADSVVVENVACECEVNDGKNPGFMLGLVSMILGIFAFLIWFCCCCCLYYAAIPHFMALIFAVVAWVLGMLSKKKSVKAGFKTTPLAKVGLILGICITVLAAITVVLTVLFWILYALGVVGIGFLSALA